MTTPPQQQPAYGMPARLPIPGNAEFVLWLVVELVIALVALTTDSLDGHGWVDATKWLTAAYLLSRGIAKASRVLEQ